MLCGDLLNGGLVRGWLLLQLMSRFYVGDDAMPEMGSGFRLVEAADADADEAVQVIQREFPGAVTACSASR